jgi:8-oxo-dGTP pyrophosphatase MutT (NUDIX family)
MPEDKPTHAGGIIRQLSDASMVYLFIPPSKKGEHEEWVLPKGHIEKDESPDLTAVREVAEETGYFCRIIKKLGMGLPFSTATEKNILVVYFLMEIRSTLDDKIEKRGREKWFTAGEVQSNPAIPIEIKKFFLSNQLN